MMYDLEIDFWDNVIDGVYSENHKFLTIVYLCYCNILSSSQIILHSKSHGAYELFSSRFQYIYSYIRGHSRLGYYFWVSNGKRTFLDNFTCLVCLDLIVL